MRPFLASLLAIFIFMAVCEGWWGSRSSSSSSSSSSKSSGNYAKDFYRGAKEMYKAYSDMRKANTIGADKYFHAKGNYEAAKYGKGGKDAARVISNAREFWQGGVSGRGAEDTKADQEANKWGRSGGDPNKYRPKGLDPKY